MAVQRLHQLRQNNQLLHQAAHRWLLAAKEPPDTQSLFVVQRLHLGFERGLPIPGPGQGYRWELEQAFFRLLNPRLDPAKVYRWLLANPNAASREEWEETLTRALEEAKTWEKAAQSLLEAFYDRMTEDNSYYWNLTSQHSEGSTSE